MTPKSVIFFGSFQDYSTIVAEALHASPLIDLLAIVTTPPLPAGRQKVLNKTHTHLWAEKNHLPVFTPEELNNQTFQRLAQEARITNLRDFHGPGQGPGTITKKSNPNNLNPLKASKFLLSKPSKHPDFFVVAGYSKLLPPSWLSYPKVASLNLHFSLLPDYRGANPAEWAILLGETETGVTMIDMAPEFDTGHIITRATHPITDTDTRETIYKALYRQAAHLAVETIPHLDNTDFTTPQEKSGKPFAHKFSRADGFIDWQFISSAINGQFPNNPEHLLSTNLRLAWRYLDTHPTEADGPITPEVFLDRAIRALSGFPGIWTYISTKRGKKRLKILSGGFTNGIFELKEVQVEGQSPATFNQIKNQILTSPAHNS